MSNLKHNTISSLTVASLLTSLLLSTTVLASPQQSIDKKQNQTQSSYQPNFFSQYNPQSALDMVKRLPGFVIIDTDNNVRGFVSSAGNVLIDGNRPTTKSGGIEEALSRIPASDVHSIELLRGAIGAADGGGQAVVANVIRKTHDDGNIKIKRWQIGATGYEHQSDLSTKGELTVAKQFSNWRSTAKINAIDLHQPRTADIERFNANGRLTDTTKENRPSVLSEWFVSGDANG